MVHFNCNLCGSSVRPTTGKEIYPHRKDLHHKNFYACDDGHAIAYVGCHSDTTKPLGKLLADSELRKLRTECHRIFDYYWKKGKYTRSHAYKRLSNLLNIPSDKCHIGMFNKCQCVQMLNVLEFEDL